MRQAYTKRSNNIVITLLYPMLFLEWEPCAIDVWCIASF